MACSRCDLRLDRRAGGAGLPCQQPPLLLLALCPELNTPSAFWDCACFGFPGTHTLSCFRSFVVPCVVYGKRSWVCAVVSAGINHWCLRLAVRQNQSH